MKYRIFARILSTFAAFALPFGVMPAKANDYPNRPVKVLVGFPAGQATDTIARRLSERLSKRLGQPFVIENRPGSGGGIAAEMVAKADSDGYTLLASSSGPLAVNPWLYSSLRYDPVRDFAPVAAISIGPLALLVNANSPYKTVAELVAAAKAAPGKLNYASGGNGVTNHLAMEMFMHTAGIKLQHVPYKGGMPAMSDLMAKHVDVMFEVSSVVMTMVQQGKLKALAVSSGKREAAYPDIPTLSELGYPGFQVQPWTGVVAPSKTPRAILDRLNAEINAILKTEEWQAETRALGGSPLIMSRGDFGRFIQQETAKWGAAVRMSGAKID